MLAAAQKNPVNQSTWFTGFYKIMKEELCFWITGKLQQIMPLTAT